MTLSHSIEVVDDDGEYGVRGYRCPKGCAASASYVARCPRCGATTDQVVFPGHGTVWSTTVLRIPNGEFPADRTIAYVDLHEGPRVLCEMQETPVIGQAARISGVGIAGTPVAVRA